MYSKLRRGYWDPGGIRTPLSLLVLVLVLALAGCAETARSEDADAEGSQSDAPSQDYTADLTFEPSEAEVGETVTFSGADYPAGEEIDLVWYTADGKYELDGETEFLGQRYDETSEVLATIEADTSGAISGEFEVPLDYGGAHDVRGRVNGDEVSQASLTIAPSFEMTPDEGPIGTPIELKITGVDSRTNINTWHVLYNNDYFGFMSGVETRGVAVANFRAAGPVGDAHISVWHNSFNSIPYLNWPQGPYKDVPGADFTFTVTGDQQLDTVHVEDFSDTDDPWPVETESPGQLDLSVDRGIVGQETTLQGSDLPANAELTLRWWTMVGNRVSSTGFTEESVDLDTVETDTNGAFTKTTPIPDDLGGQHRIEVVDGDEALAAAGLVIQPSVHSISATTVRVGDQIDIHLKGVGWTTYDNTYAITYDNSYIGYVCGFSTNGDVQFSVTATGQPGTHIIDLYPTIYKGQEKLPDVYSVPQLTYATDHPRRTTPAIRLAIEITE